MTTARYHSILRISRLLIIACFLSFPAQAKYGGGSGTLEDPYLICTAEQLHDIGTAQYDWDKHFRLMADIGLSNYSKFNIIGRDLSNPFTGSFNGNGHTIFNLTYIETSGIANKVGLFGYVNGFMGKTVIKDLGLIDPNIDSGGGNYVGSLVGQLFDGTIIGCYVRGGSVSGGDYVGGLVGGYTPTSMPTRRKIIDCYCTSTVLGNSNVGGLVGSYDGTITSSYFAGDVAGNKSVGGLLGDGFYGEISNCYSTGRVLGIHQVGGLVGSTMGYGVLVRSTSSSSVFGFDQVGGLVGLNIYGEISNCYCTGSVSAAADVGGLAGVNQGAVSNCYSAGSVEGTTTVGGLIGSLKADPFYPDGTVCDSFWDVEASGQATSPASIGKTTTEMRQRSTFAAWDFIDVWDIAEDQTYPFLRRCAAGDLDGDCKVDFLDFQILAQYWLQDKH